MDNSLQQIASRRFLEEYDFLRRYAVRCAPRYDLADDLVNEVFKQFVGNAKRWDLQGDVRSILVHLARAASADCWREHVRYAPESLRKIAGRIQRRTEDRLDELLLDDERNPIAESLDRCIEQLPSKSRRLLEMHYWKKIPMAHIAEATGVKATALRQAMVRIREKLRLCIEKHDSGGKHD